MLVMKSTTVPVHLCCLKPTDQEWAYFSGVLYQVYFQLGGSGTGQGVPLAGYPMREKRRPIVGGWSEV